MRALFTPHLWRQALGYPPPDTLAPTAVARGGYAKAQLEAIAVTGSSSTVDDSGGDGGSGAAAGGGGGGGSGGVVWPPEVLDLIASCSLVVGLHPDQATEGVCVRACVRACVCVPACVCSHVCVRVRVRARVILCVYTTHVRDCPSMGAITGL